METSIASDHLLGKNLYKQRRVHSNSNNRNCQPVIFKFAQVSLTAFDTKKEPSKDRTIFKKKFRR
jgi:hypothetical protein